MTLDLTFGQVLNIRFKSNFDEFREAKISKFLCVFGRVLESLKFCPAVMWVTYSGK
jgi:hypothetical protein